MRKLISPLNVQANKGKYEKPCESSDVTIGADLVGKCLALKNH